ncbi:MAG: TIGR02147 family protein [Fibrobacteria bacterium]
MSAPKTAAVSVLEYADYRVFLKDYYQRAHAQDKNFSHRLIASKVGSSSSGWFSDLLNSRQNLAGTQLVKLASLLKLGEKEADYFESLVHFNQSASLEEKNRYYRKLIALRDPQAKLVGQERFEYYSKWYYSAIRELLFFHEFSDDHTALAKKLQPPIRPSEAADAIKLLESIDFIHKDAQGRYRPLETTLKKDPSFKSLYAVNFLKASMELGMDALEKFPKEERHISAMTLSYSDAFMAKAVVEIEALRKKLLALMEEDPHPEKVYQMNLQFFPLTK